MRFKHTLTFGTHFEQIYPLSLCSFFCPLSIKRLQI
jgi:hypothetical protein